MLSRQVDRARLAYGRVETSRPRQFVFFGSINDRQYLLDSTGNRRFWPVWCTKIDDVGLGNVRDQLWAEAAHREAQGESHDLSPELWSAASSEQQKRRVEDAWGDVLLPLLDGKVGKIETAEINKRLGIEPKNQNPAHGKRVAAIMAQFDFERVQVRKDGTRVWAYRTIGMSSEDAKWILL
jgi:predicted P-loop ATPase